MRAAGLTFLTQEVLAGAVNPEQSEQTREVENALPAVPVQEERSSTADHQRPAREATLGFTGLPRSAGTARADGVGAACRYMHLKSCQSLRAQSPRDSATCPVPSVASQDPQLGGEKPLRDLMLTCPALKHVCRGKEARMMLVCRKYRRECINQQKP